MRALLRRVIAFFGRRRLDMQLDDEVRAHLDLLATDYERRGMSSDDARHAARRAFGGVEPMKERYRDRLRLRWLEDLGRDLGYALRGLRRNPGFTAAALLTLALGIGANTALFTVIDAVMLKPLPVTDPGDLWLITGKGTDPIPRASFSYPAYQDMRQQVPAFADVALFGGVNQRRMTKVPGAAGGDVETVSAQTVSGNIFSLLGVRPAAGRLLDDGDDRPDAAPAAVLSDGFWTRRFGRDPSIVGRAITINNVSLTVVGVAPRRFSGIEVGARPDLWVQAVPAAFGARDSRGWRLIARLRPGVNLAQAAAQADAVFEVDRQARIAGFSVGNVRARADIAAERVQLEPGRAGFSALRWRFRQPLLVLMTVVALVLLIACANVANLLLARAAARSREMTVRMALGSGRGRLIRQHLVESAILAGLGGLVAIGIALLGGRIVAAFLQTEELIVPVTVNMRLIGFTLVLSLAVAFVAGVIPALVATRLDLARRDTRTIAGPPRLLTQHALVVAQVALSIVVLVAAGLFLRTLTKLQQVDIGFERDNLTTASLDVPATIAPERRVAIYRDMLDRLNAVPGQRAAISMFGMLTGSTMLGPILGTGYQPRDGDDVNVGRVFVSTRFFETTGMRIVAGRPFTATDDASPVRAAVVNETLARRFFGANAVGRQFSIGERQPVEVVGVVADSVYRSLRAEADEPLPTVYVPALQSPVRPMVLEWRDVQLQLSGARTTVLESRVREMMRQIDPAILVLDVQSMDAIVDRTLARERLLADLAGWLGFVSLALGAIGIYGVRSYAVNRRVSELGVRLALGATAGQVSRAIVKEGAAVAGIGITIGLIAAGAVTRLIGGLLFGVTPLDVTTFAVVAALFAGTAIAASYVPARRAGRVNPLVALRTE